MDLEVGKEYKTRNGKQVLIVYIGNIEYQPVVGIVIAGAFDGIANCVGTFNLDGTYNMPQETGTWPSPFDIVSEWK